MVIDGAHVQHTAGKTSTAKKRKSRIAAISVTLANCCQKEGPAINTVYLLVSQSSFCHPCSAALARSHCNCCSVLHVAVAVAVAIAAAAAQMRITYTPSGPLAACLTVSPQLSSVCICLALHFIRDSFLCHFFCFLLSGSPCFYIFFLYFLLFEPLSLCTSAERNETLQN